MAIREKTGLVWFGIWLAAGASALGCGTSTTHAPSDGTQTRTGELGTPVYFYASPTGTGTQCSVQQPCSLLSAQDRVRAATPTMTGDISVRLFAGTYRLTSPLIFSQSSGDGATGNYRVVYEANPGAHPIISGGRAVTGWQQVTGTNQWRASVPTGFDTRQVYVNGVRAARAASDPTQPLPDALTKVGTGYTTSGTTIASWGNPSDIEFVYELSWVRDRCGVASITGTTTKTIVMDQPCFDNLTKGTVGQKIGNPTYVENARELLDQPGEWYLDRSASTIYYIPRTGEDLATAQVEAGDLTVLSYISGESSPLRNLTLRGLTFAYAGWTGPNGGDGFCDIQANYRFTGAGASLSQGLCLRYDPPGSCPYGNWTPDPASVAVYGTDGLVLERNTFVHLGAAGVQIGVAGGTFPNNTTIVGNVFRDTSGSGLLVGGVDNPTGQDTDNLPRNTTITNNWISNVGAEHAGAVGLFQGYTHNSVVQHNQVNGVPYTGISSGWGWGYHPTVTSGTMILANLVFDHMLHLPDGGGIYLEGSQGPGPNAPTVQNGVLDPQGGGVVAYNFIHGQRNHIAFSIYPDEGSRFLALDHNVLFDNNPNPVDIAGCHQAEEVVMGDMLVSNNWWQYPSTASDWIACANDPKPPAPDNIFYTANNQIMDSNQAPSSIRETAGLEPRFEDIRLEPASGFNLAYRKPAKAFFLSGSPALMQSGSEAESAVDGDPVSYAQATSEFLWLLQVDLLELQDVDRVKVTMPSSAFATALHVDVSQDGASYTTVATRSGLSSGTTDIPISAVAARFIRIVADQPSGANQTGGQMAIAELAVFGRPDLALHKNAVAKFIDDSPAVMQPGSIANLAVDGIASTFAQASIQFRWQLVSDLGIARPINRVIVAMPSDRFATQYHIDASSNGSSWTTVATVSNGVGGARASSVSGTARYVRVVADKPDAAWQTGGQMAISRLSVYGGADLAFGATATAQYLDGTPATMQSFGAVNNALDHDTATWAQATNQYLWRLRLDLGASKTVGEVDVLMPAAAFATEFHIDTSVDGVTWVGLPHVTTVGVGGLVQTVFPQVQTIRYVRVVADLPNAAGQRGGQMGIAEVIVTR
jgi:hypothetical protein